MTEPTPPVEPPGPPPARPPRIFVYLLGLIIALVIGYELGQVGHTHPGLTPGGGHTHGTSSGVVADVSGLSLSSLGYTLVPEKSIFSAGTASELRFRIVGPGGAVQKQYALVHDKPLHLVVARRDLSGYQHLHPALDASGTWSVPLTLPEPGMWRAIADFTAVGSNGEVALALGMDLTVAGAYQPVPLPASASHVSVDGYSVTCEGEAQAGATVPMTLRVFENGSPAKLEQYLGAYGHLVLLREGDLSYVHVHPDTAAGAGVARFFVAPPGPGRYRMFFDFQLGGSVHTAQFTVDVR